MRPTFQLFAKAKAPLKRPAFPSFLRVLRVAPFVLCLVPSQLSSADNWPLFRGPEGTGQCKETGLPLKWSSTENIRWKTSLPGPGMSSPTVWGDRIFLTQSLDKDGRRRALMCFSRKDGKLLWQDVTEFTGKESTYDGDPHYCSATPATDGERVVASFASAGLVCCDMNGKRIWSKDLGKCDQIWGTAASPIIYKDLVIQNFGPGERTFLIALNKRTGKEVWKVDMPGSFGEKQPDWTGSWSTPVISQFNGREELIMSWPDAVKAYEPATGKLIWTCSGMGKLAYTSPLVTPELVVAMSGFMGPAICVKRGGAGDVTETHRLWRHDKAPQRIGSGVIVGDHVYMINENGVAQCIEVKSGKVLWEERATSRTWGSLIHADGKLYVTNQQGETLVMAAKPSFEVLGRNPLNEKSQSSPAISNGDIYVRTYEHLWCISMSK